MWQSQDTQNYEIVNLTGGALLEDSINSVSMTTVWIRRLLSRAKRLEVTVVDASTPYAGLDAATLIDLLCERLSKILDEERGKAKKVES